MTPRAQGEAVSLGAQTNSECRREAAIRDVRAAFHVKWQKLLANYSAELAEIDRQFWAGEFRDAA